MWLLLLALVSLISSKCYVVTFNESKIFAVSQTVTTLQVVANPLLNPKTSPVAATAWKSLENLGADLVRYVPWFPYPKVGVAELDPPVFGQTFWDFKDINPQLEAFMKATLEKGHTVIPNFSTQPTWMYDTKDWSYPANPNSVDWTYPNGNALPNTTKLVAEYYGRLISWLTKGGFVDEAGNVVSGGHHYKLTHWEVFNEPEGCHGLNYSEYTKQYDAVVKEVRRVADPNHEINFVGLALSGREIDWITYFLIEKHHDPAALPINWISYHYYTSCSNKTDPDSYEQFFQHADKFFPVAQQIMDIKDTISPHTKIDIDEIGVILSAQPTDNIPWTAYWNAAGAYYAYLYGKLSIMGYDVLGQSQLAGSPPIPEWGIPDWQYPSVSLLNWTTGVGNARYWVLKLLLEHFAVGDHFIETNISTIPTQTICSVLKDSSVQQNMTFTCSNENETINEIQFASFGSFKGKCGEYEMDGNCQDKNTLKIVKKACLGKNHCTLNATQFQTQCRPKHLVVQATCSGTTGGFASPAADKTVAPFVQIGWNLKTGKNRFKALIVNKNNEENCVNFQRKIEGFAYTIDANTGDGPARRDIIQSPTIILAPYAVTVLDFVL